MKRLVLTVCFSLISVSAGAVAPVTTVDAPPTLALIGIGVVAAVWLARYFNR